MKKKGRFATWVDEYVDYRRQLGYQLIETERRLRELAEFMDREAPGRPLTDAWVLRWREANPHRSPRAVLALRPFVPWLSLRDSKTTVSETWFVMPKGSRLTPYIYEPEEIDALMAVAWDLPGRQWNPNPLTYVTVLGLQAATGMRIGESLRLNRDDIDWRSGVLRVRESKGVRLRMVPLHDSALEALSRYAGRCGKNCSSPCDQALFLGARERRLSYGSFFGAFQRMLDVSGVPFRPHPRAPRIHDLRHTFATRHLLRVRHEGGDMHCAVADLSVYLGHRRIEDTYWYLTGIPELMALCGERFRTYVEARRREGRP